jgi:hypothetical protein
MVRDDIYMMGTELGNANESPCLAFGPRSSCSEMTDEVAPSQRITIFICLLLAGYSSAGTNLIGWMVYMQ